MTNNNATSPTTALQKFWQDNVDLMKDHLPIPPRQGEVWDGVKNRWVLPENAGKTVMEVQGKKRIRGTGVGAHESQVSRKKPLSSQRYFRSGSKFRSAGKNRRSKSGGGRTTS